MRLGPIEFREAPEVGAIAEYLVAKYHPHLADEDIRCIFRSRPKAEGGRTIMATIQLLSGKMRYLAEARILIEVAEPIWEDLTEIQRTALIDHELLHVIEDEEDAFPKLAIRGHSIEEFNEIGERYGAVFSDIQTFMEAVTVGEAING